MPGNIRVGGYTRTTKTGKTIQVGGYSRSGNAATEAMAKQGRTPVAAKTGTFPTGRSTPSSPTIAKADAKRADAEQRLAEAEAILEQRRKSSEAWRKMQSGPSKKQPQKPKRKMRTGPSRPLSSNPFVDAKNPGDYNPKADPIAILESRKNSE